MMNTFVFLLAARALASAAVTPVPVRPLPLSAPVAAVLGALSDPARASSLPLPVPAPALIAALADAQPEGARAAFDGSSAVPPLPPVSAAPAAASGGLHAMRADDEPWLASVVGELMRTRTGRRVLRGISRLEERRGYPVIVEVAHISNNGEFRYDSDILVMDASHRRSEPALTAPILAHELQHVLQRSMELPTDALELEIESYTVENRVWGELGLSPPQGSFAAQARKRLLRGVEVFVPWLARQYKNNFALYGHAMGEFSRRVSEQRERALRRVERAKKDIRLAEKAISVMRASGMPEQAVAAHAREALDPARRRLKEAQVSLAWCERDLALLADETGRARLRAFSRGVIRRARSLGR